MGIVYMIVRVIVNKGIWVGWAGLDCKYCMR